MLDLRLSLTVAVLAACCISPDDKSAGARIVGSGPLTTEGVCA